MDILLTLDLLVNSLVIGATIWVFFLQSPVLFALLGRDKFLSPMMRITELLLGSTLPICCALVLALTLFRGCAIQSGAGWSALVSLGAVATNSLVVVPRALQAGRAALRNIKKKDDDADDTKEMKSKDMKEFAVKGGEGGSQSGTKALHQTVVLFVTIMLGASVLHMHLAVHGEC